MSLIGKLLGRHESDPYAEGIALFEAGSYADAAVRLRSATNRQRRSVAGSLAAFYRRQALTSEGRRLLRDGRPAAAVPFLAEAVAAWDEYPDLHFLLGLAQALAGAWQDALVSAGQALRRNADYVEARLLEATALQQLGRPQESAASLNKLLESGRRVDNPLIMVLARPGGYRADALPADLAERLAAMAAGPPPGTDMAAAVALCRAGRWEEGVARLRALCAERPDYPDYRVKLAAALYQTGHDTDALTEVERALALNPTYRTAAHLKALILADQERFAEARSVIVAHPSPRAAGSGHPHEALFSAYLTAVLALLTGRWEEALGALAEWDDLTLSFPRGELVRAAAEDLLGRCDAAGQRLAGLAAAWPADADYLHLHVCHLLRRGELAAAERALGRWPAGGSNEVDDRPLLLAAELALAKRRALPTAPEARSADVAPALRLAGLRHLAQRGDWSACYTGATALWAEGWGTERVALLLTTAAVALAREGGGGPALEAPRVVPESVVPFLVALWHRSGQSVQARELCRLHRDLHGEDLRWTWLWSPFWLAPVRRWIG